MHIIEVIPLTVLPPNIPQILSYFHDKNLDKGSVVEILMRNRKVTAVVIGSQTLEEGKMMLRKSDFQLKKLHRVLDDKSLVSDNQFKIAIWLSKNYFSSLGQSLKVTLPPFFMKRGYDFYPNNLDVQVGSAKPRLLVTRAKKIVNAINHLVESHTNRGQQVLILVPEMAVIEYFMKEMGDQLKATRFHSGLKNKETYDIWRRVQSGEIKIIIGTRQSLLLPWKKLKLIINEDPQNESYKSDTTPKYNTKDLARFLAQLYDSELIETQGSQTLDSYQELTNRVIEERNINSRPNTEVKIINIISEFQTGNFSLFSRELKHKIKSSIISGDKILILSSRKGYSGVLACQNCGFTAKCPNCQIPYRVRKNPEPLLACYHCSTTIKIPSYCSNCNSHKIKAVGMPGSEKIRDQLRAFLDSEDFSHVPIEILDNDTAEKIDKEFKIIELVKDGPSILVSSQMVFSHRHSLKFDFIAVPTSDGFLTVPDFRAEERLIYQLDKLHDFKPNDIYIQTHNPDNQALINFAENQYSVFYDQELIARKTLNYPPFSRLVKLTFRHRDKNKAFYASRTLAEKIRMVISQLSFREFVSILGPSPAFIRRENNIYNYYLVLKIKPDFKIDKILKFIPSNWSIDVDPRSIV